MKTTAPMTRVANYHHNPFLYTIVLFMKRCRNIVSCIMKMVPGTILFFK